MSQQIRIQICASVDFDQIHDGEDRGAAKAWAAVMDMAIGVAEGMLKQHPEKVVDASTAGGAAALVAISTAQFLTERAAKELKAIGKRWPLAVSIREGGELHA